MSCLLLDASISYFQMVVGCGKLNPVGSKADKVGTAVSSFQSHKGCVMHSNYCGLSLAIFPMRKPHAEEDTSKVMCLRLEASVGKALSVLSEDFCLHPQG